MDIRIHNIPRAATEWTVTRALAEVLHSDNFPPGIKGRVMNFKVNLNIIPGGGIRNDGTGILTVPDEKIGHKFIELVEVNPMIMFGEVDGKDKPKKHKLKFYKVFHPPHKWLKETLDKTPFIDPDIEEERQQKLWDLEEELRINAVQFGTYFRQYYPSNEKQQAAPRSFSIEWEGIYTANSMCWMKFDYDDKLIRLTLGDQHSGKAGHCLAINFSSIQKMAVGYDGPPYICLDTLTPPVIEEIEFHRPMTGDKTIDFRKYKHRVGSINPAHATVAPYAHQMRLLLHHDPNRDMIDEFISMCKIAGLATDSIVFRCQTGSHIEALRMNFYKPKRMYTLHKVLAGFDWPVAFQLELLLRNGILNTGDIDEIIVQVRTILKKKVSSFVGHLLRRYGEVLRGRPNMLSVRESPMACFQRVQKDFRYASFPFTFQCSHVTFTPTRLILDGPYASQSNRVVRGYVNFEDHFIRVDFRDEDRLQYRWDREVDGKPFLEERVGRTLKEGFSLAGRDFEFLAYSSSALREHSVWFMNPFDHPEKGRVNAAVVRDSLGSFQGTELLRQPSKFAARLAQAFTATDPSVQISRHEWEEVDDLGNKPYLFTDGVGTISEALANKIWAELCRQRRETPNSVKPSAYQIRFLGYKGVVAIDKQLDRQGNGIHMRLRPSMNKFTVADSDVAPIEIAQSFERPNACYLNRPLVMVLEDVGVRMEALKDLQDIAVRNARKIDDSIQDFLQVITEHGLGNGYRLRHILTTLQKTYGMDLKNGRNTIGMDSNFLRQIRQVAMNEILRDIKHSARIAVPDSYLLVGVADEGPAYIPRDGETVFCLGEAEIYACIQQPGDKEPTWLEGNVSISRSPVVHVGDVQRVFAIGKPPEDQVCLFAHLVNVVVLPSTGDRSLASKLGGGDVDGDLFSVICYDPLLPTAFEDAAAYDPAGTWELERDCTVNDICDFVVRYIDSDLLGLLSDRLLVIADQSIEGMRDENCVQLAELCSHAVDFPKQGIAPNLDGELPRTLIRCKPDWHAAEVVSPRSTDYYESQRALGFLFRDIKLDSLEGTLSGIQIPQDPLTDPISQRLLEKIQSFIGPAAAVVAEPYPLELVAMFARYADEIRYVSATHTLSNTPGVKLAEAEIVVGTILAKCSQKRFRKDRIYRMRLHSSTLVRDVQRSLIQNIDSRDPQELKMGLAKAWKAWHLSLRRRHEFGANSFGLVALGIVLDCIERLEPFEISVLD